MVSTLTDRNHAPYIDVFVVYVFALILKSRVEAFKRGNLKDVWGEAEYKTKKSVFRGFGAKKAEVAVPCWSVQLGTVLRKALTLVNVGGGVDFIQANMFLDPAHLNWITKQTADGEESLEQTE